MSGCFWVALTVTRAPASPARGLLRSLLILLSKSGGWVGLACAQVEADLHRVRAIGSQRPAPRVIDKLDMVGLQIADASVALGGAAGADGAAEALMRSR